MGSVKQAFTNHQIKTERKRWLSEMPKKCNICEGLLEDGFVDGKTNSSGCWAIMCLNCYEVYGTGLGLGLGQQYDKEGFKIGG